MRERVVLLWAGLLALMVGATVAAPLPRAWGEEPEMVARVNGEVVTRAELRRVLADPGRLRRLKEELGSQEPDRHALERLAVEKLITRRLLLQEAGRRNFTVSEHEVNRAVAAYQRRMKNSRRYAAWLKSQGLDHKSLRESIRANLLIARLRAAVVRDVRLTDEEVQADYVAHMADLQTGEQVRLRTIALTDKAAMEEILAALNNGGDFEGLARERSVDSHSARGGDMGWVSAQTLPPPLREAIGGMKQGEVGGPVQHGDHLLIVRLEERRPAHTRGLAEARPEIERRLLAAKQEEVFQAWLAEQEKKSKIEVFLQSGSLTAEAEKHSAISSQLSASETDVNDLSE